jgi:crotonobetaine/carnitine-CoA ligase
MESRTPRTDDPAMPATGHRPAWFDPTPPAREDCVLRDILDSRARRSPDRICARFEDGSTLTYAECLAQTRAVAAALRAQGVHKGDRVLAWLPSGKPMVLCWFAINYLGAIYVPLNTAYKGAVLQHVVNAAAGAVMIAHPSLADRLQGLALEHLRTVITDFEQLECSDGDALGDLEPVDHWDIQSIIYTSGTTGPSKGVLSPYLQGYTTAVVNYGYMGEGEGILVNLPMFHVGGTSSITCALVRSGSFYLVDGFSTTRFWDQVREGGCTTTSGLIGVMAAFLAKAEPRPDDRDSPIKYITMFPVNEDTIAFARRFGFDYLTGFNMTEVSTPLMTDMNAPPDGSCGWPRTGMQCRLVDGNDIEVPRGSIGELIVRSDTPWSMNAGYDGLPEATARVWRNGWFHTGDLFRQDAAGKYYFVDRLKDTIRRRGENISSFEVENAVRQHPDVDEVVVVGVQNEVAEQDVLAVIKPKPGRSLDPAGLIAFLEPRLAYFMIPRYVRQVDAIPKTETNKARKVVFRDDGITADTWDRERAGIHLRRERL